jgi:hypothetical protein
VKWAYSLPVAEEVCSSNSTISILTCWIRAEQSVSMKKDKKKYFFYGSAPAWQVREGDVAEVLDRREIQLSFLGHHPLSKYLTLLLQRNQLKR